MKSVLCVFAVSCAMFVALPAGAQFEWLEEAADDVLDVVDDVGDALEDATGIDLDWADDFEHLAKEVAEELCELLGRELGKDCHIGLGVSVDQDGQVTALDGDGNPAEKPEESDGEYIQVWLATVWIVEEDLLLDPETLSAVLVRAPAGVTVPSRRPRPFTGRSAAPDVSALFNFVVGTLELASLGRESRKMGFALETFAATIPKGKKVKVKALFINGKYRNVYPENDPALLAPGFEELGPFEIVGTKEE